MAPRLLLPKLYIFLLQALVIEKFWPDLLKRSTFILTPKVNPDLSAKMYYFSNIVFYYNILILAIY